MSGWRDSSAYNWRADHFGIDVAGLVAFEDLKRIGLQIDRSCYEGEGCVIQIKQA